MRLLLFLSIRLCHRAFQQEQLPKGFVAIGNKSGSDNTNIETENAYTGGFTYTHPNATARALAASRGFAVPGGFATTPY